MRPQRTDDADDEPGRTTLFFNVGRKHLVSASDIARAITEVTQLPPDAVGTIEIRQRFSLVDVADAEAERIILKLSGVKLKGATLAPAVADPDAVRMPGQ